MYTLRVNKRRTKLAGQAYKKTKTSGVPQTLVMDRRPICSNCNTIAIELAATIQAMTPKFSNFTFQIIET